MTSLPASTNGPQPRPLQPEDTRTLLELRRWLENALHVCGYAIQSSDPAEHRAAIKVVTQDFARVSRKFNR